MARLDASVPLVVRAVVSDPARLAATSLLAASGVPSEQLRSWTAAARIYALVDLAASLSDPPAGVAVLMPTADSQTLEIRWLVLRPTPPDAERRLLDGLGDLLRSAGVTRLVAAVDSADPGRTRLLENAGFRAVEPGHLAEASGWLAQDL